MDQYSTPQQVAEFSKKLKHPVLWVFDIDGNCSIGYCLAKGAAPIDLGEQDDPKRQSIPFGTTRDEIEGYVHQGILEPNLFAARSMDVRLPGNFVDYVNKSAQNAKGDKFAFLTSRDAADAVTVLKESGIEDLDKTMLVADSGCTMLFEGKRSVIFEFSPAEQQYLDAVSDMDAELNAIVNQVLEDHGVDTDSVPSLYIEKKGIARSIHYRRVLDYLGEREGSELDEAIGAALKQELSLYADAGPEDEDGLKTFAVLDAPASIEIKAAKVNKGLGLEAIMERAAKSGTPPKAVVFAGDDVCGPGTDYFGMVRADELQERFNIPVYNIHTHHPEGGKLDGTVPDPNKSLGKLPAGYDVPRIDLVVATPVCLVEVALGAKQQPVAKPNAQMLYVPRNPDLEM